MRTAKINEKKEKGKASCQISNEEGQPVRNEINFFLVNKIATVYEFLVKTSNFLVTGLIERKKKSQTKKEESTAARQRMQEGEAISRWRYQSKEVKRNARSHRPIDLEIRIRQLLI